MSITLTKLASQVYVSFEKPEADKLGPPERELFWKPRGGLWTSTLDDEGGDWVRWLKDQDYSLEDPRWGGKLWRLEPTDANVFVVASPVEYNELADRFPYPDNPLRDKGLRSMEKMIDWPAVAENYDAIHIPNPRSYRFPRMLPVEGDLDDYYAAGLFFDTCDAESTCWFRWCFDGDPKEITLA